MSCKLDNHVSLIIITWLTLLSCKLCDHYKCMPSFIGFQLRSKYQVSLVTITITCLASFPAELNILCKTGKHYNNMPSFVDFQLSEKYHIKLVSITITCLALLISS